MLVSDQQRRWWVDALETMDEGSLHSVVDLLYEYEEAIYFRYVASSAFPIE